MTRHEQTGSKQTIIKYYIFLEIPKYPKILICTYCIKLYICRKSVDVFFLREINGSNLSCLIVVKSNVMEHCRFSTKINVEYIC